MAALSWLPIVPAHAAEATVAVAANFAGAFGRMAKDFSVATGHTLRVSSGASGNLTSQIVAGAPFDVLLAADQESVRRLLAGGHAVAGSRFTYATGRLVLWSARPGFVDAEGKVLARGGFTHLALANPRLAPYGAAAIEVLGALGLLEALTPRLVTAESVAQAWQFVATGNAELGFVALSQVASPGTPVKGSYWLVPTERYRAIRQDAVLLRRGADNPAARALLAYLKSAPARALVAAWGYAP